MFDYMPNKVMEISNNALKLLKKLFPYEIIVLNPNDFPNNKYMEFIYVKLTCPECGKKLHYNDLWNRENKLSVALIRTCHKCRKLFLLSGRFDHYIDFLKAYSFYDNKIYSLVKNKNKKKANENTHNQGGKKNEPCKS